MVSRGGQLIGLRFSGIEGLGAIGGDETAIDVDGLAVPRPAARRLVTDTARRQANVSVPAEPRGLTMRLGGRTFWLPADEVIENLGEASPIPVPWADPTVPEIVFRGSEALPVVRVDTMLGFPAAAGPLVLAETRSGWIAFRVDALVGVTARGEAERLTLDTLLPEVPAPALPLPWRQHGTRVADEGSYLAIAIERQRCLLPLASVGAVMEHVPPPRVPGGARAGLIGIRSVGGTILPVVDQRAALGLSAREAMGVDIVLTARDGLRFVLVAREIDGFARLSRDAFSDTGQHAMIAGIARIDSHLAWLLTPDALPPRAGVPA